jgi:hypothetical protein
VDEEWGEVEEGPDDEDQGPDAEVVMEATRHLRDVSRDLHPSSLPAVPASSPTNIPWDKLRRLYVQGIACGPSYPDRTAILEACGEDPAHLDDRKYGSRKITRIGRTNVLFPSMRGVAKAFGLPEMVVTERARDEDWVALQRIYRAQLNQRIGHIRSQKRLLDVERIDRRAYAVSRMGLKMVYDRLEMMSQTVEVMDGEVNPVADYKEMESLARATAVWHQVGRRALGFPVDKVGVVHEISGAMAGSEVGMWELGDPEVIHVDPENYSAAVVGDGGVAAQLEDTRPSVAEELSKDDSERLHGFLSVLGRAQDASAGDGDESGADAVGA